MIDEARLVTVKHGVKAEGEELILVCGLDCLLAMFVHEYVVHIEEVGETFLIVVSSPHVPLFLRHHLSDILQNKRANRDLLHGEEAPHEDTPYVSSYTFSHASN